MKRVVLALCAILLAQHAFANAPTQTLWDAQQEARAVALQRELRCVVCQGESLDESGAPLAADLRRLIRARIEAGDTDDAIKRYLVARYGVFILMKPPLSPDTYFLWFGPPGLLLIGGLTVALVVWRARRSTS